MADQEILKPTSGVYSCMACQVAFETTQGQRTHYQSEWHRYNLKRKVAELPPVASDVFKTKFQAQKTAQEKKENTVEFKGYCDTCRKPFGTQNSFNNHIQSKKHKDLAAKLLLQPRKQKESVATEVTEEASVDNTQQTQGEATTPASTSDVPTEVEPRQSTAQHISMTVTEETTEEEMLAKIDEKIKAAPRLEETDCLFCTHKAESFEENLTHMTHAHSFFIPDIDYLVDLKGLIQYLGEKISVGNVCIFCNGKGRSYRSLEAVRGHMSDKAHWKIAYESDDDAADIVEFYDFSSSYPQPEEGEEVDIDAELGTLTNNLRLADDEMSLVLPSGAIVGHRSLKRYYDQKLKPEETRDSVLINQLIGQYIGNDKFESLRSSSRAGQMLITDGRNNASRPTEAFKDRRVHYQYETRVGIQANKLQKYFKVQII
ncbi:C2H2 type zinc-finger-domain-containing protein [Spinellus fusiger]|nr:C2H2 type zinc-finger-domain-containing protein [Spinellus fusiger]